MSVDLNEVIKVLEVTSKSVGGNGMRMCASSIDWAIEQLKEILRMDLENDSQSLRQKASEEPCQK